MGIFTKGHYIIDIKNPSYINALIQYNQNVLIEDIEAAGNKIIIPNANKKPERLSNLANIIETVLMNNPNTETITINYRAFNSSSLKNVFPPLPLKTDAGTAINKLADSYLKILIEKSKERGFARKLTEDDLPEELTREEAVALAQKYGNSGAIELGPINTILFQNEISCFYLTYGKPCMIGNMVCLNLDIDDGFIFGEETFVSDHHKMIADLLQNYFIPWKESGYKKDLFPPNIGINFGSTHNVVLRKPQLERILTAFGQLKNKKTDLENRANKAQDEEQKLSCTRAVQALEKMIDWFNAPIAQYQSGAISIESLKQSVTEILNTDDAKKEIHVIHSHRGTKQFWAEFIGAIFTIGLSLVYKALKGCSLFKVNTDAANTLEEFQATLVPR